MANSVGDNALMGIAPSIMNSGLIGGGGLIGGVLVRDTASEYANALRVQEAMRQQQWVNTAILGGGGGAGIITNTEKPTGVHAILAREVEVFRNLIKKGEIMLKEKSKNYVGETFDGEIIERPKLKSSVPQPEPVLAGKADLLKEYQILSEQLNIRQPHLEIELFRQFLEKKNITVFPLASVIAYMDEMAKKEAKANSGWCWRPLREQDHLQDANFGNEGAMHWNADGRTQTRVGMSDRYRGPFIQRVNGMDAPVPSSIPVYDQTIPLHALRKVAEITKEFGDKVKLFVSDYAPMETIVYPDPFLMAVVDNPALARGVGRFVIDFWDEPGFGLTQQLGLGDGGTVL